MKHNALSKKIALVIIAVIVFYSCNPPQKKSNTNNDIKKDVELVTDFGSIVLRLSDETPIHRDNFLKLTKEGFFDSIQWHRVVDQFLIQTGDPSTKAATDSTKVGAEDVGYDLPAEIRPNLFHKRGAINAARWGDEVTPERKSSGSQFTIIQGMVYNDSVLNAREERLNKMRAYNKAIHLPKNKKYHAFLKESTLNETNKDSVEFIQKILKADADMIRDTMVMYKYPESHRNTYKTIGGAAHLDQNYTVFGEVLSGMEIVDSIARVETKPGTSVPVTPVRILKARLIDRVE